MDQWQYEVTGAGRLWYLTPSVYVARLTARWPWWRYVDYARRDNSRGHPRVGRMPYEL
jgi:hypothetical protein